MSATLRTSLALAALGIVALAAALWLGPTHLANPFAADEITRTVVWDIRLPRALTAWLAGAALGLTGAALQGVIKSIMSYSIFISSRLRKRTKCFG